MCEGNENSFGPLKNTEVSFWCAGGCRDATHFHHPPLEEARASKTAGNTAGLYGARSALALLVYINAALQICLLRCAFSDMFRDNIQFFLFTLFVIRITIKVAFTSFMCELMLTVPIAITNQALELAKFLSKEVVFLRSLECLAQVMYVALIGLQFMERIYIGPNEDQGMLHVVGWLVDEKPPPPPAGSAHDGWPEPDAELGLGRYRVAFLAENQLWLQAETLVVH
eukprot:Skav207255  [mRNA]  locus=scaffold2560:77583:86824:+ [translate_table: standard]